MIAACATHIPLPRIPVQVAVIRDGRHLKKPPPATAPGGTTTPALFLQAGDEIRVSGPAQLRFSLAGNRYRLRHGTVRLGCRRVLLASRAAHAPAPGLAVNLQSGRIAVKAGRRARRALVLSREMLTFAIAGGTDFVVDRNPGARRTRSWTLDRPIVAARASDQALRINTRATYTAISDAKGLRLDIWPFSISPLQRPPTAADRLMPFWADGLPCSVGCTPAGAIPGWPIKPFHHQHAIRAGINELRPANFHVAVDIEAHSFQRVYAIQSGYAAVTPTGSIGDSRVQVGAFSYWHLHPTVSNRQYVVAYKTEIGAVLGGFGHLALSEGSTSHYLNPLRPGGSLRPYADTEPPVIGIPHVFADGRVSVGTFDPQSFVEKESYETPVLAPSSLAWRLYDARGRPLTDLQWAMRGSRNYPPGLKPVIFAPGASNPGFGCFFLDVRCVPNWVYWLAGGLTAPLPLGALPSGRYRLTVYAWDWAGNTSALDYWLRLPLPGRSPAGRRSDQTTSRGASR